MPTRRDEGLTEQQEQAALAVACSPSVAKAAEKCGAHERTIRGWLKENEDFRERVEELRHEATTDALGALKAYTVRAVEVLFEVANNDANEPRDRISAAKTILEYTLKPLVETGDEDAFDDVEGIHYVRRPSQPKPVEPS